MESEITRDGGIMRRGKAIPKTIKNCAIKLPGIYTGEIITPDIPVLLPVKEHRKAQKHHVFEHIVTGRKNRYQKY